MCVKCGDCGDGGECLEGRVVETLKWRVWRVVVVTLFYIDLFLQKYCFSSQLYTYVQAN